MTKTIPARDEVPSEYKWRIMDLYSTKAEWQNSRDALSDQLARFSGYQGKLSQPQSLLECLTLSDHINSVLRRVYAYASLQADSDSGNAEYQEMKASVMPLLDRGSAAKAFIEPELLALPEECLRTMAEQLPGLQKYEFFLKGIMRQKRHVLSAEQEAFLASTGEILQSARNTYMTMKGADLKFPDTPSESGTLEPLTESRYSKLSRSRDRKVREAAFHNLYAPYFDFRNTFASLYSTSVKSLQFISRTRKYDTMLEFSLDAPNIPASIYESTIETTHKHLPLLHRYMALRKRLLQLDELHMYDFNVPIGSKFERQFPYEEGLALIRAALAPLGETYLQDMFRGIGNGWIDLYENMGKQSGAYSFGVYDVHPFILTNYDKQYESVSTLVHELGHAMHSFYSSKKQAYINAEYSIFCAEVASMTNENLLLEYMLKSVSDKEGRTYFLNQYLDQIRGAVYRQVFFAEFEKITHEMVENGQVLTADALEALWLKLNRKYYGNQVVVDEAIKSEWARIPHFYMDFYVYQYATGYAASFTLSHNLRHQGEPARQAYLDYLASGGSDYSIPLLQKAGVDMTSSTPLDLTFEKFAACLDELEELTK